MPGKSGGHANFAKGDGEKELSLLVIPIIVKFKEIVPATHFDSAILEFTRDGGDGSYLREMGEHVAQLKLLPKLFSFDELMAIPISHLKRVCQSLCAENEGEKNSIWTWEKPSQGHNKRTNVFLRYLVGWHGTTQSEEWFEQAIACARLQESMMRILKRNIERECTVGVNYKSSFYDALYTGMWHYQIERLDCLARNVMNSVVRACGLRAEVGLQGDGRQFGLTVSFFLKDRLIDGRNYLLRLRPGENAFRCLHRVKSKIEASGISTIAQDKLNPSSEECKKRSGSVRDMPAIVIPI